MIFVSFTPHTLGYWCCYTAISTMLPFLWAFVLCSLLLFSFYFLGQISNYFLTTFNLLNFHLLSSDDCISSSFISNITGKNKSRKKLFSRTLVWKLDKKFYIQDWFQRKRGGWREGIMVLLFYSGKPIKNQFWSLKVNMLKKKNRNIWCWVLSKTEKVRTKWGKSLKGVCHEIFDLRFFHKSVSLWPLSILLGPFLRKFAEIFATLCSLPVSMTRYIIAGVFVYRTSFQQY